MLVAYLLFFSVQICFRYTSPSVDLDEYSSSVVKTGQHIGIAPGAVFHPVSPKSHILNKRFQPVDAAMPVQDLAFDLGDVSYPATRTYFSTTDPVVSRDRSTTLLRGPPVPLS